MYRTLQQQIRDADVVLNELRIRRTSTLAAAHFDGRALLQRILWAFLARRFVKTCAALQRMSGDNNDTNNNDTNNNNGLLIRADTAQDALIAEASSIQEFMRHTEEKLDRIETWKSVALDRLVCVSAKEQLVTLKIFVMPVGSTVVLSDVDLTTRTVGEVIDAISSDIHYPSHALHVRVPGSEFDLPKTRSKCRRDVLPASVEDIDSDVDPDEPVSPSTQVPITLFSCGLRPPDRPQPEATVVLHGYVNEGDSSCAPVAESNPTAAKRGTDFPTHWVRLGHQFQLSIAKIQAQFRRRRAAVRVEDIRQQRWQHEALLGPQTADIPPPIAPPREEEAPLDDEFTLVTRAAIRIQAAVRRRLAAIQAARIRRQSSSDGAAIARGVEDVQVEEDAEDTAAFEALFAKNLRNVQAQHSSGVVALVQTAEISQQSSNALAACTEVDATNHTQPTCICNEEDSAEPQLSEGERRRRDRAVARIQTAMRRWLRSATSGTQTTPAVQTEVTAMPAAEGPLAPGTADTTTPTEGTPPPAVPTELPTTTASTSSTVAPPSTGIGGDPSEASSDAQWSSQSLNVYTQQFRAYQQQHHPLSPQSDSPCCPSEGHHRSPAACASPLPRASRRSDQQANKTCCKRCTPSPVACIMNGAPWRSKKGRCEAHSSVLVSTTQSERDPPDDLRIRMGDLDNYCLRCITQELHKQAHWPRHQAFFIHRKEGNVLYIKFDEKGDHVTNLLGKIRMFGKLTALVEQAVLRSTE